MRYSGESEESHKNDIQVEQQEDYDSSVEERERIIAKFEVMQMIEESKRRQVESAQELARMTEENKQYEEERHFREKMKAEQRKRDQESRERSRQLFEASQQQFLRYMVERMTEPEETPKGEQRMWS